MATPRIYAHRGASIAAPENTIEAYEAAREQGADGVELDVRRSADGSLVLVHDPTLPDGRSVAGTPADELPSSVPTLEAALDVLVGLVVNIEIKNIPVEPDFDPECVIAEQVVRLLHDRGRADRVVVSSFHLRTIDRVKALDDGIETGFLTLIEPTAAQSVALAADRGHDAIHPYFLFVDGPLVGAAHERGLAVNTWTVDEPDPLRSLAALGVDGIVTNVPDFARGVLSPG